MAISPPDFSNIPALLADIDEREAKFIASRVTAFVASAPIRSEVAMYGWALSLVNASRQLDMSRAELDALLDRAFEVVERHQEEDT